MWSVFFVFLSYLDRNVVKGDFLRSAPEAEKESKEMFSVINGTFCAKMSMVGENFLYQVSDGAEVVRTVVSPAGKLVNCSIIVNQIQVKSFMHECRLGLLDHRGGQLMDARFARLDETKGMCREFRSMSRQNQSAKASRRSKRGFTYPGTLWCGAGNMADHYNQLGEFAQTDSCCRTHDHCQHVIHPFSSNFGYTNFKWLSISHCDCDEALKECLRKVNDTSSRVVGQAFFNVLTVPCFEFAYEEQCVERHWYGLCKGYKKVPVAVLKESAPYDFGGIQVIDELTVAPPKKHDGDEKPESATQSTVSEPSLRNVVMAAEDFIKVLATVSTSQSSPVDSEKGEAQSSEKKKKKKTGQKKKTGRKQKGKSRRRKQKTAAGVKTEERAVVSSPESKAEEVLALRNVISESHTHTKMNTDVDNSYDDTRENSEASNEVMKDEPEKGEDRVSAQSHLRVQKKPADSGVNKDITPSPSTVSVLRDAKLGQGMKKGAKVKETISAEDLNEEITGVASVLSTTQSTQTARQSFGELLRIAGDLTAIHKVRRERLKVRGGREPRKNRIKVSVVAEQHSFPLDNLNVILPTTSIPPSDLNLPHKTDTNRDKIQVTVLSSNLGVLKKQRSKDRESRNRRRKTILPAPSENPDFSMSRFGDLPTVLTTPNARLAANPPANTALVLETETQNRWRIFTTAIPTVNASLHRQQSRHQRKSREKATALDGGISVPKQTEEVTPAASPDNAIATEKSQLTSAGPAMSPLQLSMERARAQFNRKKKRKAAQPNRQQ
uniref:phospholipase A2 n=1 Tax=Oryzias latipes TaxID=8090 RepID=A0A3P9KLC0_ORYLA